MPFFRLLVCVSVFLCGNEVFGAAPGASAPAADESKAAQEARIQWWQQARFGIFVHWGLYSILGRGEWVQWNEQIPVEEYAELGHQFAPTHFDAADWASAANDAGAKYVVLTARHHDGFALFDDPGSDFTSVKTAAHRDFVAEYVKAIRAAGLHVGLYYSPLDWRFPGYLLPDIQRASAEAMRTQYHRQVEELLSNYGKIDVLWFDGGETDWLSFGGKWSGAKWEKRPPGEHYHGRFNWEHDQMYVRLRQLQPDVVINGRADMPEDFHSREGDGALGGFDANHPWELCTTMTEGAWGWEPNKTIKSLQQCVQLLVQAAGRDGNLLLNIGPRPDGQIDPPQRQRLREIGDWLRHNGESIYNTRGGPYLPGKYGVSTRHEKFVYVHVLKWNGDTLTLPALGAQLVRASLLGGGTVQFNHSPAISITVPAEQHDPADTIVKLEFDRSVMETAPTPVAD